MKYRKKPVVVDAIQWSGLNTDRVMEFCHATYDVDRDCLLVKTLEGEMAASPFDWIIKGVKGECYPCKPDIFKQTYESVSD